MSPAEGLVPPRGGTPDLASAHCRCWHTTAEDMREYLGPHLGELGSAQLQRFVRAWHEVDQRYGPDRRAEADAALGACVLELVRESAPGR